MNIPVVDRDQQPLMPTTSARAQRWIRRGKATALWKGGVFCVRLNREPSSRVTQPFAVGIDPGSKKEALVVKSAAHTYLNVQAGFWPTPWSEERARQRTSGSCVSRRCDCIGSPRMPTRQTAGGGWFSDGERGGDPLRLQSGSPPRKRL